MERIKDVSLAAGGRVTVTAMMIAGFMGLGALAPTFAVGSDAATAVDAKFTELQGDITTVYIPALLGLVVLGIGVLMGVKWLRKGAAKA